MRNYVILLIALCSMFPTIKSKAESPYYSAAERADSCARLSDWPEAERILLEALRSEPANPLNSLLLSNLGIVRARQEKYDEALEALDAAIAMAPASTVAVSNRGRVNAMCGRAAQAYDDFSTALRLDPALDDVRLARAAVSLQLRRPEEAKADYKKIIDTDGRNADALAGMAHALEAVNDNEGALQYYNRSLAERANPDILLDRALLKTRLGDLRGADADVREGLQRWGTNGNLILMRGYLARLRYRNQDAGDDLRQARRYGADPDLVHQLFPNAKQ